MFLYSAEAINKRWRSLRDSLVKITKNPSGSCSKMLKSVYQDQTTISYSTC